MRKCAGFLIVVMLCSCFCLTAWGTGWQETFDGEGLPQGWTADTEMESSIAGEGGVLRLGRASADSFLTMLVVNGPRLQLQKEKYVLRARLGVAAGSVYQGADDASDLFLSDTGNKLLSFKSLGGGVGVYPFGQGEGFAVQPGAVQDFTIAADPQGRQAAVWMGETEIYRGQLPSALAGVNYAAAYLGFTHTAVGSGKDSALLADFLAAENQPDYAFSSTPSDGEAMLDVSALSEITVEFGAYMEPAVFAAANLSLESGGIGESLQPAAFAVQSAGNKMKILPQAGLESKMQYKLTINAVRDVFGKDYGGKAISFTTAEAGYVAPSVHILEPADGSEIYQGQSVTVRAEAEAESGIAKVEFFQNGVPIATLENREVWEMELDGLAPGTYTFTARVTDLAGGSTFSQPVTLTVKQNLAPIITVEGISSGGESQEISVEALKSLQITANDPEGALDHVEVYLNDALAASSREASFTADLSGCPIGKNQLKIIAFDGYGARGVFLKELVVVKTTVKELIRSDFNDYTGGKPAGFGTLAAEKNGYVQPAAIDQAHGTSVAIGSDAATGTTDIGPQLQYIMTGTNRTLRIENEVYFPTDKVAFMLRCRNAFANNSSGNELKIAEFSKGGQIKLLGSGGKEAPGLSGLRYETGRWYHMECVLNGANNTYDFYLDGQLLVSGRVGEGSGGVNGYNQIRWSINTTNDADGQPEGGFVAVDNVRCMEVSSLPYIDGVYTTEGESEIDYAAEAVYARLSAPIVGENLAEYLALTNELGVVPLRAVDYDSAALTIKIQPQIPLYSNMAYKIALSEKLPLEAGKPAGYAIQMEFTTSCKPFDVVRGTVKTEGNTAKFEAELVNNTPEARQAVLVLQIWEGKRLVRAAAREVTLAAGTSEVCTTDGLAVSDRQKAVGYVMGPLGEFGLVSEKTFQ